MSVRAAFFTRLENKFHSYLTSTTPFKGWDMITIYRLSEKIISKNSETINKYLDSKRFKLKDFDKAIEIIKERILIPDLETVTI